MSRVVILVFAVLSLGLSGCATLSSAECKRDDWYRVGLADALNGRVEARIKQHSEACADDGVVPDLAEYRRGREAGLLRFCTVDGGLRYGRRGREYQYTCPEEAEAAFMTGYDFGHEMYLVQLQIQDIYHDLERVQYSLLHHHHHRGHRKDGFHRGRGGRYGYHDYGYYGYNNHYDGIGTYAHLRRHELTRRLVQLEVRLRELEREADYLLSESSPN